MMVNDIRRTLDRIDKGDKVYISQKAGYEYRIEKSIFSDYRMVTYFCGTLTNAAHRVLTKAELAYELSGYNILDLKPETEYKVLKLERKA